DPEKMSIGLGSADRGDIRKQSARACCTLVWWRILADVMKADVAHDLAHMPAGKHIVAYDGDAVFGERLCTNAKDGILDGGWHPTEYAMADHIVEALVAQRRARQVSLANLDVCEAECGNALPPVVNVAPGNIDADEVRFWEADCQRNNVATRCAAELKNACA